MPITKVHHIIARAKAEGINPVNLAWFEAEVRVVIEGGDQDEIGVLEAVIAAVGYWQGGQDERVLERLNPEWRYFAEVMVGLRKKTGGESEVPNVNPE